MLCLWSRGRMLPMRRGRCPGMLFVQMVPIGHGVHQTVRQRANSVAPDIDGALKTGMLINGHDGNQPRRRHAVCIEADMTKPEPRQSLSLDCVASLDGSLRPASRTATAGTHEFP